MEKFNNALISLAKDFDQNNIEYMVSGSMAGKFYGLTRMPNDIDIYIRKESMPKVSELFRQFVTKPLYHCIDDFFDEYILELMYMGVTVEISIVDNAAINSLVTGERIPLFKFYVIEDRDISGSIIKVQALSALIGYKSHNTNQKYAKNQINDVKELSKYLA